MKYFKCISFVMVLVLLSSNAFAERWQVLAERHDQYAEKEFMVDEDSISQEDWLVSFIYRVLSREAGRQPEEQRDDFRIRINCEAEEYEILEGEDVLPSGYRLGMPYALDGFVPIEVAEKVCP